MPSHQSCRVCLKITPFRKLKAIFEDAGITANNIYLTTGVQIMDMLNFTETAMICEQCENSLDVAVNFRKLCRKSDLIFREITFEHEEKNWAKNLLTLQYNIPNEEMTDITEVGLKCEVIENPVEAIHKVDDDESEYEYIAYEIDDLEYVDENNQEENIEYLESEIKDIQDLKLNERQQKKIKAQHNPDGVIYECEICGKNNFSSKTKYRCHLYRHRIKDAKKMIRKQCIRCGEEFGTYIKWELHMELEHPMIYTCDYCGGISRSRAAFTQHIIDEERNRKPYLCSACGLSCKSLHLFQTHKKACTELNPLKKQIHPPELVIQKVQETKAPALAPAYSKKYAEYLQGNIHDGRRRNRTIIPPDHDGIFYKCEKCGKNDIPSKAAYTAHLYRHLKEEARNTKQCIRCGEEFGTYIKWETHMERFHPTTYICDYCGESFRYRAHFTAHILQEKRKFTPYVCGICGRRCKNRSRFKAHKASCHKVDKLFIKKYKKSKAQEQQDDPNCPFICKVCGGVELTESALRKHMKRHKAAGENIRKPIDRTCFYCGYVAPSEDAIRMHVYMHRKKNLPHNIFCTHYPYCKTKFFSPNALQKHIFKYHRKEGIQWVSCDHCGQSFQAKFTLKRHLLTKHFNPRKIKPKNPNDENHPCIYCGKMYTTPQGLRSHEQQHVIVNSGKIYFCDLCGKQFDRKGPMQTHMKFLHCTDQKYKCNLCPEQSWSNRMHRDNHIKQYHSNSVHSNPPKEKGVKLLKQKLNLQRARIFKLKENILKMHNKL